MLVISTIHFSLIIYFSRSLPVWLSAAGSLASWNQATSCLSLQDTGLHSKKFLALPWILAITWPEKLVTALLCLLKCLMTQILSVSWCGWSVEPRDDLFFKKGTSWFPRAGEPLSSDERPRGCDRGSWERRPKLLWTWPSSVYMADWDLSKCCLHWLCLDEGSSRHLR